MPLNLTGAKIILGRSDFRSLLNRRGITNLDHAKIVVLTKVQIDRVVREAAALVAKQELRRRKPVRSARRKARRS